jgi:hypothetical protein
MQLIASLCATVLVANNVITDRTIGKTYAGTSIYLAKGDPPPLGENDKKIVSRSKPPKHPKPPKDHKPPDKDDPDHDKDDPD